VPVIAARFAFMMLQYLAAAASKAEALYLAVIVSDIAGPSLAAQQSVSGGVPVACVQ
jgi:hypothetical protein